MFHAETHGRGASQPWPRVPNYNNAIHSSPRKGHHQAVQDMYAVKVEGGKFKIVSKVAGPAAVGPDTCTRF